MTTLGWIIASGALMSSIALVGSLTLFLSPATLRKVLLPLVAFAAGTLLGGSLLHILPAALERGATTSRVFLWLIAGFMAFFFIEQFLHWRHCSRDEHDARKPLTYLVLLGDGLHNFLDGMAVGGAFIIDVRVGVSAWVATVAHEIPQELGDFAVLVHGGWRKRRALLFNVLSGLTFLLGGVVAYSASRIIDVSFLLPFAAGNFLYIAASDLIPEVRAATTLRENVVHSIALAAGIMVLFGLSVILES